MPFKVVLIFNQLVSFNRQFGTQHLAGLERSLRNCWQDVEVIPIVNGRQNSCEERADKIADRLSKITKTQKIHLLATGVAGVDARIVYNSDPNIISLSTFGSPHKGSFIASDVERGNLDDYKQFQSMLGIDIQSFQEMSYKQMQSFNLAYPLHKPLFTAGGVYPIENQSNLMQYPAYTISRKKEELVVHDNDGLFAEEEVIYGYGLGIYDLTHPQVIGYGNKYDHFRNAVENIRTIENE